MAPAVESVDKAISIVQHTTQWIASTFFVNSYALKSDLSSRHGQPLCEQLGVRVQYIDIWVG